MSDETWTSAQYQAYLARGGKAGLPPPDTRKPPETPAHILGVASAVRDLAKQYGWLGYRTQHTQGDAEFILGVPGRCVVILCKAKKAKLTQEQVQWLSLLNSVPGMHALVARPGQLEGIIDCLSHP